MVFIKELSNENKKEIESVFFETFSKSPWNDNWDKEQLDQYMNDLIAPFNSLSFGLFFNNELIGISLGRIAHFYDGNQYRVDEFCILTSYQGQKFGSKFIELLSYEALKRNIKYIILNTERIFPAYKFYLKNGFEEEKNNVMLAKKIY